MCKCDGQIAKYFLVHDTFNILLKELQNLLYQSDARSGVYQILDTL